MKSAQPKIAIIVLNWNGKQDTLACLESLGKLTYSNFEVLVVDNGSTDGSQAAIRQYFPNHTWIQNTENLGFAEGCNVGLRAAIQGGADLFFLLNNDTVAAADILERFLETFQTRPDAGILGAKILLFDERDTLDHLGGMWNSRTGTFTFTGMNSLEEQWQITQELDYVCGAGMMIKKSVIEAIGYFDPRFFLIWEESDYCFRARVAGFKVLTSPQAKVWHRVSASFIGGKPHSAYYWWRNRLLWIEKNCSIREKASLYLRILIPEILHKIKIQLLKKPQLSIEKLLKVNNYKEKENKLTQNRAILCAFRDYLFRRFGKGPDWISKP
jgi:GT2 family glycosyltransferase